MLEVAGRCWLIDEPMQCRSREADVSGQTYLRFCDVTFRTVPSSNHASPSSALPFLLPAVSASGATKAQDPVPSNRLKKWIAAQEGADKLPESDDLRYEAYASLLDHRIRKAWVHAHPPGLQATRAAP